MTKTDPGFKGDTATNATKPATLETGAEIKVPLFIDEGDMIRVDTRTGGGRLHYLPELQGESWSSILTTMRTNPAAVAAKAARNKK